MTHPVFEEIEQLDQALRHLTKQAPGLPIAGLKAVVDRIRAGAHELAAAAFVPGADSVGETSESVAAGADVKPDVTEADVTTQRVERKGRRR